MVSFLRPKKKVEAEKPKKSLFSSLSRGLKRTRSNIAGGVATLVLGKKTIDDELLEEIEMQLLVADVGVTASQEIIESLTEKVKRKELKDPEALISALKNALFDILEPCSQPLQIASDKTPFIVLMVGVNGAGKTTTIGKLAKRFQNEGKKVMLAAGDTFRAAAVEQLEVWGERNAIPVVAQGKGADSASVIYDAMASAKARDIDVLIADTAGRLHTQTNLMEELKKIQRVIAKLDESAPHEVMLVLDAGIGQNALRQVEEFSKAVSVSGIVLTKLDGTAKGGVIFAIAQKTGLPIRFVGVGEAIDDLQVFDARSFIDALFQESEST